MDGPFLHLINYDADPEHEHAFDVWYNTHILNVLKCPAYQWSSRYVSLEGNFEGPYIRNLTMYMIEDMAAFEVVLAKDERSRHPALKKRRGRLQGPPGGTLRSFQRLRAGRRKPPGQTAADGQPSTAASPERRKSW